jgi:hypothetical protein
VRVAQRIDSLASTREAFKSRLSVSPGKFDTRPFERHKRAGSEFKPADGLENVEIPRSAL